MIISDNHTRELIAKLKEVLEIDKPLRSLKVEWEQGGPVSVTTETIAVGPAIEQTEGDKLVEMMENRKFDDHDFTHDNKLRIDDSQDKMLKGYNND